MINYLGTASIQADRPLQMVAEELNNFFEPLRLSETDRFDEVPGFIAEVRPSLSVELQGIPDEVDFEEHPAEPCYFLTVRFTAQTESEIPTWIGNLPSNPSLASGYSDISCALVQVLAAKTNLRFHP
jgi:hypothetical protein